MIRRMLAFALVMGLSLPFVQFTVVRAGDDKKTLFKRYVLKGSDKDAPYYVYAPPGYTGDKAYPTILFLHGAGETDNEKRLLEVGLPAAIKKSDKGLPFIVVVPMALTKGWQADGPNAKRALAQLEEVKKNYKVDEKRIYLTGLSMGGFGTWSLAAAYPDKWAAIAPICGGGNPGNAEKIKTIPTWNFHGDKDTAVNVKLSRDMIDALKKAGGEPKYTEYPGVGHNSWDAAYGTKELYGWLLKHQAK